MFPSEYPKNTLCAFVTSRLKRRANTNTIIIIIIIIIINQMTVDLAYKWIKNWAVIIVFDAINSNWQISKSKHYNFTIVGSDTDKCSAL
jgi:hypothetical protein